MCRRRSCRCSAPRSERLTPERRLPPRTASPGSGDPLERERWTAPGTAQLERAPGARLELRSARREPGAIDPDAGARDFAIDPRNNVVLEASAGTGKTSVLVWRYVNLLKAGVEPGNILAITFTRKAAAEMRERIIRELKDAAARSEFDKARWIEVRDRLGGDLDQHDRRVLPVAAAGVPARGGPRSRLRDGGRDRGAAARRSNRSIDRCGFSRGLAKQEPDVAVVLAQLGISRTREGPGVAARTPSRRLGRAQSLPRERALGPDRLKSSAAGRPRRCTMRCAPSPAACPGFSRMDRSRIRATSCSFETCSGCRTRIGRCPGRRRADPRAGRPRRRRTS